MRGKQAAWRAVLAAALVAGGISGVYAAPTLEDHETRIGKLETTTQTLQTGMEGNKTAIEAEKNARAAVDVDLQQGVDANKAKLADHETRITELKTLTDKIDDRSETDHMAIKALKQNKADKADTEKAINENKETINQEVKDRKSADRILNEDIKKEEAARVDGDTALQQGVDANKAAIADNKTAIGANKDAIAQEQKDRADADTALRNDFTAADEKLEKKLSAGSAELGHRIDRLETDTNKGLARVTALAGLHPLDYDPANKWNIAVASGSYNSENAIAVGAFYRPNRNIMLSFGSSVASGENAYTFGASFKLGRGSDGAHSSASVKELYNMIGQLERKLEAQQRQIEDLEAQK
ncbi:MAG: YadA-like family protein [Dialister sp.]|nr:YadA-like family protein [Dialister sp.]